MDIVERLRNWEIEPPTRNQAADEIERLREQERKMTNHAIARMEETERLREALIMWDVLIEHQYSGSKEAMSDMTRVAQHTAQLLYGDPPWPWPHDKLKEKE